MKQDSESKAVPHAAPWLHEDRLEKLIVILVLIQLLAAPMTMFLDLIPLVIGFGPASFIVNLRYLASTLFGASLSLPVLFAFVFAWADRKLSWRFWACIPLVVFASINAVVFWVIYMSSFVFGGSPSFVECIQVVRELAGNVIAGMIGVVCFPLFLRAMRGIKVTMWKSAGKVSNRQRLYAWIEFVAAGAFVLSFSSLIDNGTGLVPITGLIGVVFGLILSLFVLLLLREQSARFFWTSISVTVSLFIGLPILGVVLSDFVFVQVFTAGNGVYFVGVTSAAVFLLTHLLLFWKMGYRIRRADFEVSKAKQERPVVDPFSD